MLPALVLPFAVFVEAWRRLWSLAVSFFAALSRAAVRVGPIASSKSDSIALRE